ncbi:MAG: glycerol-3-phosphate 1-O-acyltransferase PlsY [Phycisphaerales bacterium]
MSPAAWLIPLAFLSGSIPFGLLIGLAKGVDVRKAGSGNIGSTNVGRLLGRKYFFLCLALDFLKGLLPTLLAGWKLGTLGHWVAEPMPMLVWIGVMLASVLGHVFCPWLSFKGGKGVATSLGALVAVFPVLTICAVAAFVVWAIVLKVGKYMSLASMAAGVALPVACVVQLLITGHKLSEPSVWPTVGICALLAALVVFTHRGNIKRLRAGTEPKFGQRVTPSVR